MSDRGSVSPAYPAVQGLRGCLGCLALGAVVIAFSGLKMALLVAGAPAVLWPAAYQ